MAVTAPPRHDDNPGISILIADNLLMFAECLKGFLDREPDLDVRAIARTGEQALALARAIRPRVMLADFFLPDMDGVELTRRLRAELPCTDVVIVTAAASEHNLLASIEAGCAGFLSKERTAAEAARAVRCVAAGEVLISGSLLNRLLERLSGTRDAHFASRSLSERELEILHELALGKTNRLVAEHLHLSVHTVRNHVQSILAKMGAHSKLEAVTMAVKSGLISLPKS